MSKVAPLAMVVSPFAFPSALLLPALSVPPLTRMGPSNAGLLPERMRALAPCLTILPATDGVVLPRTEPTVTSSGWLSVRVPLLRVIVGPNAFAKEFCTFTFALTVRPPVKVSGPLLLNVTGPALTTSAPPKMLVLPLAKLTAPLLSETSELKLTEPELVNASEAARSLVKLPPFSAPGPPKVYGRVLLVTAIAPGASEAIRLTTLVVAVSSNCTLSPAKNLSEVAPFNQLLAIRSQALGLDGWPPVH